MNKWDVCLAKVPFEDVKGLKVRPVLVLEDRALMLDCLKMTGHAPRKGEYVLKDWRLAGLHKETTVRIRKCLTLKSSMIIQAQV